MLSKNLITNVCYLDGVEITESEYNTSLIEIRAKAALVDKLYSGEITISDVPEEWQEEIQLRSDMRTNQPAEDPELTAEEALAELLEAIK